MEGAATGLTNAIVHVLMSVYTNGVDEWRSVENIYATYDAALMAQIVLEQNNTNTECQSWHVAGWPLLTA